MTHHELMTIAVATFAGKSGKLKSASQNLTHFTDMLPVKLAAIEKSEA